MRRSLFSLILGFVSALGCAQLRVATYNISNYSGGRTADLQTVFYGAYQGRSFNPDVLVAQEVLSSSAAQSLLSALNTAPGSPGDWATPTFIDGPDTDSALFYRTSKLQFAGQTIVSSGGSSPNPPRHTMRYDLRLNSFSVIQPKIALYSVHLKAGTATTDEQRRLVEATRIRQDAQALDNSFWGFAVAGDFNVYSSADDAYTKFTQSETNNLGRLFDPCNRPGSWDGSSTFRYLHTQDPSGAGGMDSRFDFVLLSGGLTDGIGIDYVGSFGPPYGLSTWDELAHSYRCWGNDGTSLNGALTVTGNTMVGPLIAQALRNVSTTSGGHLPVFLDLKAPAELASSVSSVAFGKVIQGGMPVRPVTLSHATSTALWGTAIASLPWQATLSNGFTSPSTSGQMGAGQTALVQVSAPTATAGIKSGSLTVSSSDPRVNGLTIPLSATVVANVFPPVSMTPFPGSLSPTGTVAGLAVDDSVFVEAAFGSTANRQVKLDLELQADAQIDQVGSLTFETRLACVGGVGLLSVLAWDHQAGAWVQIGNTQTVGGTEQLFTLQAQTPNRFLSGANGTIRARLFVTRDPVGARALTVKVDQFAYRIAE